MRARTDDVFDLSRVFSHKMRRRKHRRILVLAAGRSDRWSFYLNRQVLFLAAEVGVRVPRSFRGREERP